ncbi:spore maturation protein [Tissierella carlieri]|uniref:spore maturation protein n=1 Tax=Tissierella TaxID=41273 RepID=UPI001C10EBE6|nr:spore maturation protein [Tissierella carlieri]MBU5313170.1 spore maturation protein [Tissierella carlieri]
MFLEIMQLLSKFAIPFMIVGIISYGMSKNVKVYESFVEGAKDGFSTAIRIIPSFVAMLVAIGVFRESGAMDILIKLITPVIEIFNIPGEVVPMILMRPLSGSGAQGIMSELAANHGPESLIARTVAVMMGSSETTFYVLAVYFGSVSIKKQRHALAAGLIADLAGVISAIYITRLFFGG